VPTVIINDVALEAKVGERLLNVARRNAAHIGFVCDGNGICQTCQCRVLYGADQLSPPSEAERTWMPERRLAAGHRLACQTVLRGEGAVEILTTAEELRRQTMHVISPPRGEERRDQLEPLLENLVRMSVDQLVRYPFNLIATLLRVGPGRFIYPLLDAERWADDGARVARKMLTGVERLERPRPAAEAAPPRPLAAGEAPPPRLPAPAEHGPRSAPRRRPPSREEQVLAAARALRRARDDVRRFS
jgi:ferredoxin